MRLQTQCTAGPNKKLFPVPCHGNRQRRRTDYQHPPDGPQLFRGFHTAGSTAFLLLSTVLPAFCFLPAGYKTPLPQPAAGAFASVRVQPQTDVQGLIHPLLVGGGDLPGSFPQAVFVQRADLFQQHDAVLGKAVLLPGALAVDLNVDVGFYFKQSRGGTCTLASAAMMLRRRAYLDGMDSWVDVTENGIKSTAWSGGLSHSFTYNDMHVGYATLPSGKAAKTGALVSILAEHPEGIVLYDRTRPHAVLLTDYTDGVFYCSDPSNGVASGRVPLSAASISIGGASCYWYITEDGNDDGLELLEEAVQAEEAAAETETAAETEVAAGEESSSQDWWTSLFG